MTIQFGQNIPANFERRIGTRHPIGAVVDWTPIDARRRRRMAMVGAAIDVSVSGVGFVAKTNHEVKRGTPVRVTIGELDCEGIVRSARPATRPDHTRYGVEIRSMPSRNGLEDLIVDHLDNVARDAHESEFSADYRQEDSYYSERLFRKMDVEPSSSSGTVRSPHADWSLDSPNHLA